MSSINKFIVMGRLTKDPELKTTDKGNKVANVTLALDRNYKDKDGNKITDFLNFTLWDKNAERICELSKKGALVSFEGYCKAQEIETKDGYKTFALQPVVENYEHHANPKSIENDVEELEEVKEEKTKTKKSKDIEK